MAQQREFIVEDRISQYPQLKLTFEGKTYVAPSLSIEIFERLDAVETKTKDRDAKDKYPGNLFEKLKIIFPDMPKSIAKRIDIRVIIDFLTYVTDFCGNPENFINEDQKKKIEIGGAKLKVS